MTVLITGSTGKTSTRIAQLLQTANIPFLIATRRDPASIPFPSTKLDWFDETSYINPFTSTTITSIYLVAPDTFEPGPYLNAFIDLAVSKGVRNFVLCAGTSAQKGGQFVGPVWSHLESISTADSSVHFAILRPTWFMENFSEMQHVTSIKDSSTFYTAAGDGKIPFVSADDIAEAAFVFLSGKREYGNRDYVILGPELLTHDRVAGILSKVLGRNVRHVRRSQGDMVEYYKSMGVKELYANFLPYLENTAKEGSEENLKDDLEGLIGRKGLGFGEWAEREAAKGYWG